MSRMNILSPAFIVTNFFTMRKSDRHLANIHHERHFVPLIRTRKPQWQPVNGTPCRSYDIQSAIPSPPNGTAYRNLSDEPHSARFHHRQQYCAPLHGRQPTTACGTAYRLCTADNQPPPAVPCTAARPATNHRLRHRVPPDHSVRAITPRPGPALHASPAAPDPLHPLRRPAPSHPHHRTNQPPHHRAGARVAAAHLNAPPAPQFRTPPHFHPFPSSFFLRALAFSFRVSYNGFRCCS